MRVCRQTPGATRRTRSAGRASDTTFSQFARSQADRSGAMTSSISTPFSPRRIAAQPNRIDGPNSFTVIADIGAGSGYFAKRFTQHAGKVYAVDIQQRGGGPIFAAEAGTVIRADNGWNGGYGNVVEVRDASGYRSYSYWTPREDAADPDERAAAAIMGELGRLYRAAGQPEPAP